MFVIFALSFTHPRTRRDWRAFGGFAAFVVALFAEMYGFPLTTYLLSGWPASRLPGLDLLSHDVGCWPHRGACSTRLSGITPWRRPGRTPAFGIRNLAFILIMLGFLLQWPTLLTILMFPILVLMYTRLAQREERDVRAQFGEAYDRYAAVTPAFLHLPFARKGAIRKAHSQGGSV